MAAREARMERLKRGPTGVAHRREKEKGYGNPISSRARGARRERAREKEKAVERASLDGTVASPIRYHQRSGIRRTATGAVISANISTSTLALSAAGVAQSVLIRRKLRD